MIALVNASNNILLNLLIAFSYHLIPIILYSPHTKSHLFIVRNQFFYIILLKSALTYYSTIVLISIHQHRIYWDSTFYYSDPLRFRSLHEILQLTKTYKVELA